ncbi:MAG: alpha/beta hydrolase [Roseiarcus sp.]|jgi:pimeloyl-ACP methyl ester carboxylesterase
MSKIALDSGEGFATVGALEICYQTFGETSDPALLLIAGLGAQMILFEDDFCEALAARGFWVVRFDNRDVGKSSRIDWTPSADPAGKIAAPYLLKDMAGDAVGLMEVLGIASAHIVGASMGGMIAQEIAIRWPGRVRSLTSIMSTTSDPKLPPPGAQAAQVFTAPPPTTPEEYVEANLRAWLIFRGSGFPEDEKRDRARAMRAVARGGFDPRGGQRQFLAVMASGSRKAVLARVTAPTLVIHGADDPLVPLAAGEDTAASIPGARLVVLPRMGHSLPVGTWPRIIDEIAAIAAIAR